MPETPANAAEFGDAGSGANRSALPKARVVALAEGGSHAILAVEVDAYRVGDETLAGRRYPRPRGDELAHRRLQRLLLDRVGRRCRDRRASAVACHTQLDLPVVTVLGDGTFTTVLVDPALRGRRREQVVHTAPAARTDVAPDAGHLGRAVEYDVPDRAGNGTGELVVLAHLTPPGWGNR